MKNFTLTFESILSYIHKKREEDEDERRKRFKCHM